MRLTCNISPSTPLLTTKLHIPRGRSALVSRPRLVKCLNEGLSHLPGVILISAPAGSGKTTLVVEWSRQAEYPIAWVSLDKGDNDPARFLAYIVAALDTLAPGISQEALALLGASHSLSVEAVLTVLINEISMFSHPLTLVLDDYHFIDEPLIHDVLTFLLDHLPPQLHLILTSRVDPPLSLARLRSRNQLTELRAANLRFTPDETAAFLNQVMGLKLGADDLTSLEARTEGWITGLQFAALSIRNLYDLEERQRFIQSLSGRDRHIIDYLLAEVLYRQSPQRQQFLLQTSILERMTGELCEAVTGQANGQATLEAFERDNLFIVSLDNERCWYRYHHLFADLLRHRLAQRMGKSVVRALHRRASQWYEAQGLLEEAIDYALAAEDFDRSVNLLEPAATTALIGRGSVSKLSRWLAALPCEILERYPRLCLAAAWSNHMAFNDHKIVESYLQTILKGGDATGEILGEVAAIQANRFYAQNKIPQAFDHLNQALAHVPETALETRAKLNLQLGVAFLAAEDLEASHQSLTEALEMAEATRDTYLIVDTMKLLGVIAHQRGQLFQAAKIYQATLELAEQREGPAFPPSGLVRLYLGSVFYEWNDLETANHHYRLALVLGEKTGLSEILWNGYRWQAHLLQQQGKALEVDRLRDKLKQIAQRSNFTPMMAQYARFKAAIDLQRGDLSAVAHWVKTSGLSLSDRPSNLQDDYLLLANFFIMQSHLWGDASPLSGVTALLHHLLDVADSKGLVNTAIHLWITLALACQRQKAFDQALDALEHALTLAHPGGYVRRFIDYGPTLVPLLRRTWAGGIMSDYTAEILAAFDARPASERSFQIQLNSSNHQMIELVEPLTDRELEVLQCLAAGLSNQEIADKLIVSVYTVRAHLRNIYRKLDVHRRTQAVKLARQLQIL